MLIENTLLIVGQKVIFKVSSGEEIITEIDSIGSEEIIIRKPYRIIATQQGISLAPFSLIADMDTKFHIMKDQIVAYYKLHPEVEIDYIKVTTGIQMIS